MISSLRTVAVLIWETEAIAIVDSDSHGQHVAMVGYVPHGQGIPPPISFSSTASEEPQKPSGGACTSGLTKS